MKPTHPRKQTPALRCAPLLFVACFTFAGCASDQPADQPLAPAPSPVAVNPAAVNPAMPQIPAVALWPDMTSVDAKPVFPAMRDPQTGRLIAQMSVESLVTDVLNVQYRIIWLDARGGALTPDARFKILNFPSGSTQRVREIDPTGRAVNWRAELRPVEMVQPVYQPTM